MLDGLFDPESIAVVGASREEKKVGHLILKNIISSGYEGRLYPVNPKAEEILGLKTYPSLLEIEDKVDLAVIAVPNTIVPAVMDQAGQKGVKAAVVITAGFKEVGKEGAELERRVGEIGKRYGIRILGPNCLGLINTHSKINATFTRNYPKEGGVAITSQSGAVGTTALDWAAETSVGFSKFISVGNKVDIDETELLSYLQEDEQTKVIGMYIESIDRGEKFMRVAYETSRSKPIIALKAGRTSSGARAASSHTGALSGSDQIYDAALEQSGVIRVRTIDDFFDALQVLAEMPLPPGDGVAIVTNAGGLGVLAADACADHGLNLVSFKKETIERLRQGLPEEANVFNPVDVIGDADANRYEYAIKTLMDDENVSSICLIVAPTDLLDVTSVAQRISSYSGRTSVPLAVAMVGGKDMDPGIEILRASGIPTYGSPDRAMGALGTTSRYLKLRTRSDESVIREINGDKQKVNAILETARREGRTALSEAEGKEILSAYGISIPQELSGKSAEQAVEAARIVGYPVVMKIDSPDIAHKTDVGGVVVGISEDEALVRAYQLMLSRVKSRMPQARIDGVQIQQMVSGREVIVGVVRDEHFGPVVTFGLGGIFVEVLQDVSRRIAPLTDKSVAEMVRSIKAYPILAGARGRKPADIPSLKDIISRISQIALDFPEIAELEVNPVMVGDQGQGRYAVDALVTMRRLDG